MYSVFSKKDLCAYIYQVDIYAICVRECVSTNLNVTSLSIHRMSIGETGVEYATYVKRMIFLLVKLCIDDKMLQFIFMFV